MIQRIPLNQSPRLRHVPIHTLRATIANSLFAAANHSSKKKGTDTSPAFVAEGYFGGVGRSEVRAETCLYPFS
jgi:hypothetical protein